jgi:hypothetical protein
MCGIPDYPIARDNACRPATRRSLAFPTGAVENRLSGAGSWLEVVPFSRLTHDALRVGTSGGVVNTGKDQKGDSGLDS